MFQSVFPGIRGKSKGYDILPTLEADQHDGTRPSVPFRMSRLFKRRGIVLGVLAASSFVLVLYLLHSSSRSTIGSAQDEKDPEVLPPLYEEYHRAELALPQHDDVRNAFAGGKKYMWVADHTQCKRH